MCCKHVYTCTVKVCAVQPVVLCPWSCLNSAVTHGGPLDRWTIGSPPPSQDWTSVPGRLREMNVHLQEFVYVAELQCSTYFEAYEMKFLEKFDVVYLIYI